MQMVNQVFPIKRQVPLEGLYLDQKLKELPTELGRSIVLTDFVTGKNGVIAKAVEDHRFLIPGELRNSSDWRLFQELTAQADVTISGGSYFKRLATSQDVLYQFEPGNAFEELGQWRLNAGYEKRSPDLAIVTRHLDFELPEQLLKSSRRIVIFTTDSTTISERAKDLRNAGTTIIGCGEAGVDGEKMIATLADQMEYRLIMMNSGPHILDLLLKANRLDLLYVTQVQVEIPFDDPMTVKTILLGGKNISELQGLQLAHKFIQQNVITEAGTLISQAFLRYDRKDLGNNG